MTKRSQNVLSQRFIKRKNLKAAYLPIAIALAGTALVGCKQEQPRVPDISYDDYDSLASCVRIHPDFAYACRAEWLRHAAQKEVETKLYTTPEACIEANPDKELDCLTEWANAEKAAENNAPRFDSRSSCESEYDNCQASSSGGWFMPAMAGYLIGSMTSSSRLSSPVFTPADSHRKYVTTSGAVLPTAANGGTFRTRAGELTRPHVRSYRSTGSSIGATTHKATRTTTSSNYRPAVRTSTRGGFGSSSRSSWGG